MRCLCIIFFMLLCLFSEAQNIDALQQEIKEAEENIRLTTEQLNSNKNTQKNRSEQLILVNKNIQNRKQIISSLDKEISIYKSNINSYSSDISTINKSVESLKKQYSNIALAGYRNIKQNNYLRYVLSSTSFNELLVKLYYLKVHASAMRTTAAELEAKNKELSNKTSQLKAKQSELSGKLRSKATEVSKLGKEQEIFSSELEILRSKEKNLSSTIENSRKIINKLQDEIKRIIEEEARKSGNQTIVQKEEQIRLSGKFEENIGNLPKPVSNGIIIEKFGVHKHPLQQGITVNNKGVNISVNGSANVRAIFEGIVTKVFFFKGLGNNVMVRHGSYITVYSNLSTVTVKTGDSVETGGTIGTLSPGDNSSNSMLHFEIWKETTPQDPENWIKK